MSEMIYVAAGIVVGVGLWAIASTLWRRAHRSLAEPHAIVVSHGSSCMGLLRETRPR